MKDSDNFWHRKLTLKVRNQDFSIVTCQTYVDLPKKFFYGKVLFFTQLSCHLMRKLLKKSWMVSNAYILLCLRLPYTDTFCQLVSPFEQHLKFNYFDIKMMLKSNTIKIKKYISWGGQGATVCSNGYYADIWSQHQMQQYI